MGKRRINLTCDADLLARAKDSDLNLSETFEKSLRKELAAREAAKWQKENQAAIDAYNERIRKTGTLAERLRGWR